jgi:putative ABC transport system permease protein
LETLLTLLASIVAFTLFGSMVALNAGYSRVLAAVPMDRLFVLCAFQCPGLSTGLAGELARVPGVTAVGYQDGMGGYHKNPSSRVGIEFVDDGMRTAWSEMPLSQADWDRLQATPNGLFFSRKAAAVWHVKKGDSFPVVVEPSIRADGDKTWIFTVLGVFGDYEEGETGQYPDDMILGNYRYFNESKPYSSQNTGVFFHVAVDRADNAHRVCQLIEAHFANSSMPLFCVPIREDATQLMAGSLSNMRQMSLAIAAAGIFMILFLYATATDESVRERLPELGILKAIGFNDRQLRWLIFWEAALPALLAALIGIALARGADHVIANLSMQVLGEFPLPVVTLRVLGLALIGATLVAVASTLYCLRQITHLEVAAAVGK